MKETIRNGRPYFKRKPDYMYEVPILSSMNLLLSDEFVLEEVENFGSLMYA